MKYSIALLVFILFTGSAFSQPNKKPSSQPAGMPDMNKMMEEAMKNENMSEAEKEQMRKMMQNVMPAMNQVNNKIADYPEFSNNLQLIPRKDPARTAIAKKILTRTDGGAYANGLYVKIITKGDPSEMAIVKKILAQTSKSTDLSNAGLLAMLQGYPQAALALTIKAAATDPANPNLQNNMAALLTSYGFPEQAIPVLRKLKSEVPANSTVLNNLGHAWLGLGETDSAQRYFTAAIRINPNHHESEAGKGLVEESKGDHTKAGESYEEAMEDAVNPFTDQLLKNNKGNGKTALDFEKIKRNIVIYEYFPKDWMKTPPALSNDVKNRNQDLAIKNGYLTMIREMGDQIQDKMKLLGSELDDLTKKGEEKFVTEMMNSSVKGLSFMSKPATMVIGVLGAYTAKWHQDYNDEFLKLVEWKTKLVRERDAKIDAINKIIYSNNGPPCENYKEQLDNIENRFMATVNTKFREVLIKRTEEYRQWLNAYCTWNWYVAGNIKNVILMQDIGFTQYLAEMYTQIVTAMEVRDEHCNSHPEDYEEKIDAPEIPNFTCPAVVSISAGPEWQDLVAASLDFNKNSLGLTKTDKPVPNASIAYGAEKEISEPGEAPSIKTANGSITPSIPEDDELVPLSKIPEEPLVPLTKIPLDDLVRLDDFSQWRKDEKNRLIKELMKNMMSADCNGVRNTKDILREEIARKRKEAEEAEAMRKIDEQLRKWQEERPKELVDDALWAYRNYIKDNNPAHFEQNRKKMTDLFEKIAKYYPDRLQDVEDGMRIMNELHDKIERAKMGTHLYDELADNGFQPSISSGLQAPGTFHLPKTLFQ